MQTQWAALTATALTVWLGLHTIRGSIAMIVWNIGEELSPPQLVLIALAIWLVGLVTAPALRKWGGPHAVSRLAIVFGLVATANASLNHAGLTPLLSELTMVAWLWLLPAVVVAVGRAGSAGLIAPGIAVGIAAQVALQHALHGMDLSMLHGIAAGAGTTLLVGTLLASARALPVRTHHDPGGVPGWSLIALGPYLILQMTLLANLGRVQMLGNVTPPEAAGVALVGLAAGCALLTVTSRRILSIASAVVVLLLLGRPAGLQGQGIWLVGVVQALLVPLLARACAPTERGRPGRVHGALAGTMLLMLLLLFLFYSRYGWLVLWPVMAALVALPAIGRRAPQVIRAPAAVLATVLVGGLGIGAHAATQRDVRTAQQPAPSEFRVLTYNIHMGFDGHSLPAPEAVAAVIEASGADVVGLQEVGRGWTVNGGADLASWLQWRLPQYHLIYGPMNGDLWGNAILSRFPITGSGSVRFPVRASTFQRGLVWASVRTASGDALIVNTHFSAFAPYAEDRLAQATDLLQFWNGRPRVIITGDFNAAPDSAVIQRMLAAGLRDLAAAHGLSRAPTYSALDPRERIDYLFGTPDIESLHAAVVTATASDHLPVMATVRLR